jgi:ketosteroid isomerase-like protein
MAHVAQSDPILVAMKATNDLFRTEVAGKGNITALDQVYTTDARILPPGGEMVTGREAIKQFWSQFLQSAQAKSISLATVSAEPAGDKVVEIGRAEIVLGDGQTARVNYVVVWRQEDGRWKWHIDIWNPAG